LASATVAGAVTPLLLKDKPVHREHNLLDVEDYMNGRITDDQLRQIKGFTKEEVDEIIRTKKLLRVGND
jgi:uncharacterized protein YutD